MTRSAAWVLSAGIALLVLALPQALMPAHAAAPEAAENQPLDDFVYPPNLTGSFLAARLAELQRDIPHAADFYREALELQPDDPTLLANTFLLELADGRHESALELAQQLVDAGDVGLARLTIGVRDLKARQYARALKHFEAFQGEPFGAVLRAMLSGWAIQGAGDTDQAITTMGALEGPDWTSVFKAYHAGLVADLAGRRDEALQRLETAWNADSGSLRLTQSYAAALSRSDRMEEASAVLQGFMAANAGNPLLGRDLAQVEQGKPMTQPVLSVQAGAAEVLYGLGSAIGHEGSEELAAIYLQMALMLDPKADLARTSLGTIFENLKLNERAIPIYEAIAEDSPLRGRADLRLGIILNDLDRFDEADTHMLAILEAEPDNIEAYSLYGNMLRYRKDYAGAARVYTDAITRVGTPERMHWALFYWRGISLERLGDWEKGEADFLTALELFPDQPDVLNYLGYTWVDKGMNLDRSIGMLEKAVELRPRAGYIVDSLGWVFYKLGRFDDAVTQLERAVILDPAEAVIHDHLGDAYWQVGRRLEARFEWRHALDLKSEELDEAVLRAKMADGLSAGSAETVAKDAQTEPPTAQSD